MYTVIAQMRNINIELSSLLLDTTSTEKRSYQYNKFLPYRYQYFNNLFCSIPLYLAYITPVFLASSLIKINSGPTGTNTSRQSYHLTDRESGTVTAMVNEA